MAVFSIQLKPALRMAVCCAILAGAVGCTSVYRNHGYTPSEEDLSEITVGVDTRDSVIETVGAPSSTGVLETGGYYYVSTRMRHYGARAPEIVSRELVAISFDTGGTVRNIERFGLEDGRVIALDRRVTESGVQSNTFLRQLLNNLTNFNPNTALGQ